MSNDNPHSVAIGGIGGSGTRVVAALVQTLGYYLGDDLNESMDNLWFTLLFKRRSILLEDEQEFIRLFSLFAARMSGTMRLSESDRQCLQVLVEQERLQHSEIWLRERTQSFSRQSVSINIRQPWGWKEPNTHIIINRILQYRDDLKYIHVIRHPLDMAMSKNQAQLENWGSILLNRNVTVEPRSSLSYWCAAHKRIIDFTRRWPQRMMMVKFDELCETPELIYTSIAEFLNCRLRDDALPDFRRSVWPLSSARRPKDVNLDLFDARDLIYIEKIGYDLS